MASLLVSAAPFQSGEKRKPGRSVDFEELSKKTVLEQDKEKDKEQNPSPSPSPTSSPASSASSSSSSLTMTPITEQQKQILELLKQQNNTLKPPAPIQPQNATGGPIGYNDRGYTQYLSGQQSQPSILQWNKERYPMKSKDEALMERINYMIHLLEAQKMEKTDHVMEEFMLYSLLGVFIIYICDSFSRIGRYSR